MKLISTIVLGLLSVIAQAQEIKAKPFRFPYEVFVYDLPESTNGVKYRLYVRPPLRSPEEGENASVFYFLDALKLFPSSAAMTYNYEYFNYHPAAYFVGIGYQNEADGVVKEANRTRDYTPTAFEPPDGSHFFAGNPVSYENSGRCDDFIKVISEEVVPFIEDRFEVGEDRVLIGNSMSGLAAVHVVLTQPQLFNRYIIVSPSVWWDDWFYPRHERYVMKQVGQLKPSDYDRETRVFFAIGAAEDQFGLVADLHVLTDALKKRGLTNLKIHLEVLPDELHEGVFPGAFMRGIVGLYVDEPARRASASKVKWE